MRCVFVLIFAFFACVTSGAIAQEAAVEPHELTDSGRDYLKAVRYHGVDTDVVYFDPTRPVPPLETTAAPKPEPVDRERSWTSDSQWPTAIISLIVLIVLLSFVYFSVGGTSVSFGGKVENTRRKKGATVAADNLDDPELSDLNSILRISDRQLALIGLAQLALTRCLNANGVLFKRSWTQREALRKLPQNQSYLQDLRVLVRDCELVHFGGRTITESDFADHVARVRPILREVTA